MPRVIHRNAVVALAIGLTAMLALACCTAVDESEQSATPTTTTQTSTSTQESTAPTPTKTETDPDTLLDQAGVSAGHPLAVEIGEQVLLDGGNAVDAVIAVAFAQSVVEPVTSGIGGGGSIIVAGQDMEPAFHDYREVVNNSGVIPASNSGIPGFVAGMGRLHEQYGTLEWDRLLRPSAELAAEGFVIGDYLANRMSVAQGILSAYPNFAPNGQVLGAGDWLTQPELAETINRLADAGWQDFYTGELAQSLSSQVTGVDAESLADYSVVDSEPVAGEVGDYVLASAAPPLPGVALIGMLQQAEAEGIAQMPSASADYAETLSSAWQNAEQTIFTQLGDPAFVDLPPELTDEPQPAVAGAGADNTANTTHLSVVDEDGLTVSMTNTILNFWGSGQMVDGYFVNNHLYRFTSIPSAANAPAPGKRPVTWSNPSMVFDGADAEGYGELGRPVLPVGSPGGPQILNIEGTVLAQWLLQDRPLTEAVLSPRFRASGSTLYVEETTPPELMAELRNRGWTVEVWPTSQDPFGSVQALEVNYDAGTISGADDPRRDAAHAIVDAD